MYSEHIFKIGIQLLKIIVLIYGIKYVYDKIYLAYFGPLSKIPGPKITFLSPLFIYLRQINGQRWKWLQYEIVPKYGRLIRVAPSIVVVSDKNIAKQILATNELPKAESYDRMRLDKNYSTLFTTRDREIHKTRRRILSPAFSMKHISSLETFMYSCRQDLIAKIDETINKSGDTAVIDIYKLIQLTTLDIIGETALGGSFKLVKDGNHPLPVKVFKELRRRVLRSSFPILSPFLKIDPYLIDFTSKLIKERKQSTSTRKDLLQVLMDAKDLTDFEIFDQCTEFLIAGSDTTNFALAMTMLELIRHPDISSKLAKEIEASLDEDDSNNRLSPPHDILKGLPYLNAVINEGLRLYPSTRDFGPGKAVPEDTVIGGYLIPKGTSLTVNIYALHRSEEYWGKNSHEFVPERWLNSENIPTDAFIPFSAGSRNCIGSNFTRLEMRIIIAALVLRYEFQDIPGQNEEILHFITTALKTKSHNVKAKFRVKQ